MVKKAACILKSVLLFKQAYICAASLK